MDGFKSSATFEEKCIHVGELIRVRRKEVGITFEELASRTRLKAHYIAEIEAGNFTKANMKIYYYGYVRTLCDFLEIDTVEIAKYLDFYNEPDIHKDVKNLDYENKGGGGIEFIDKYLIENVKKAQKANKNKSRLLFYILIGFIVLIGIFLAILKKNGVIKF